MKTVPWNVSLDLNISWYKKRLRNSAFWFFIFLFVSSCKSLRIEWFFMLLKFTFIPLLLPSSNFQLTYHLTLISHHNFKDKIFLFWQLKFYPTFKIMFQKLKVTSSLPHHPIVRPTSSTSWIFIIYRQTSGRFFPFDLSMTSPQQKNVLKTKSV